ncbi:MAG: Cys-tRNA(Pro) deacylase [Pseudomonadales bacterium]|nr:Cys-tRNA(Pro) deacylase [Pseudomonadales bacterium]
MTPGIIVAEKAGIDFRIHEYLHDADSESWGEEAAAKLGVPPQQVFKTLIVSTGTGFAVGVVPVSGTLNLKAMAKTLGVRKISMADPGDAERVTGYVLGGVSPLGQKKRLKTVLDRTVDNFATIFVSAGRRGLEIECAPADLASLLNATVADIS